MEKEKMSSDWKDRKCEDCEFCIDKDCRRFPQTQCWVGGGTDASYPRVITMFGSAKACFEFRGRIEE